MSGRHLYLPSKICLKSFLHFCYLKHRKCQSHLLIYGNNQQAQSKLTGVIPHSNDKQNEDALSTLGRGSCSELVWVSKSLGNIQYTLDIFEAMVIILVRLEFKHQPQHILGMWTWTNHLPFLSCKPRWLTFTSSVPGKSKWDVIWSRGPQPPGCRQYQSAAC